MEGATHCKFRNLDDILLDQLICSGRDIRLQCQLLTKTNLTLHVTLDKARVTEASNKVAESLQRQATPPAPQKTATIHKEAVLDEGAEDSDEEVFCTGQKRNPETQDKQPGCAICGGQHQRALCCFRDAICRCCEWKGHLAGT